MIGIDSGKDIRSILKNSSFSIYSQKMSFGLYSRLMQRTWAKVEWKYSTKGPGAQFVMMNGRLRTLQWCVSRWVSLKQFIRQGFCLVIITIHYTSPARGQGRGRSKNMGDHMVFRGGTVGEQSSITEIKWRTKEN